MLGNSRSIVTGGGIDSGQCERITVGEEPTLCGGGVVAIEEPGDIAADFTFGDPPDRSETTKA